jgi:hypothetical protein
LNDAEGVPVATTRQLIVVARDAQRGMRPTAKCAPHFLQELMGYVIPRVPEVSLHACRRTFGR